MTKSKFIIAIALNTFIVIGEIAIGIISNSIALLTDAFHNFGDILTLSIALTAFIFSEKKVTREMTYGYMRSEMLSGFVNSLFLLLSMAFIIYGSVGRILSPGPVKSL